MTANTSSIEGSLRGGVHVGTYLTTHMKMTVNTSNIESPQRGGVHVGTHLTTHVELTVNTSNTVKSCYFQLHLIARISRYLPRKAKERVVNALVISRLDYCNSLMHGTTQHNLDKLQRVQNSAARLIVGTSKF